MSVKDVVALKPTQFKIAGRRSIRHSHILVDRSNLGEEPSLLWLRLRRSFSSFFIQLCGFPTHLQGSQQLLIFAAPPPKGEIFLLFAFVTKATATNRHR